MRRMEPGRYLSGERCLRCVGSYPLAVTESAETRLSGGAAARSTSSCCSSWSSSESSTRSAACLRRGAMPFVWCWSAKSARWRLQGEGEGDADSSRSDPDPDRSSALMRFVRLRRALLLLVVGCVDKAEGSCTDTEGERLSALRCEGSSCGVDRLMLVD